MVLYFKLKKYFKANNELANDIINSLSYKVGYGLTYPIRFISDFFKGRKTVLFHKNLPGNDFEDRFEQRWIDLVNSNIELQQNIEKQHNIKISYSSHIDLEGYIDEINETQIMGWFRNKKDDHQRLQIYIYKNDGILVKEAACNIIRKDLLDNGIGDGKYGFEIELEKPIENIETNINIKISTDANTSKQTTKEITVLIKKSIVDLPKTTIIYDGFFDKIDGFNAIGWIIDVNNLEKDISVNLYRNNELINTGKANLYRHDLKLKFSSHYKKAFRLKIPLIELLRGEATYKICTTDKYEIGRIKYDPNTKSQLILSKLNSPKIDLLLPFYDGFTPIKNKNISQKVAIHVHIFYLDVFEEICTYIKQTNFDYDLYLSTSLKNINDIESCLKKQELTAYEIVTTPNRGRDIGSFIVEFGKQLLAYDVALHIHTKKTIHNTSMGKLWLQNSLDCLIKDANYTNAILEVFDKLDKVGIIAPKLLGELVLLYNWGENYDITKSFLKSLKINTKNLNPDEVEFPAGTMFWFKPKALEKLLTAKINYTDFPKEPIKGDGTIAHAIERSIYYIAEASGYTYYTAEPVNPNMLHNQTENIVISIIIPVYNGQSWLIHSVQSILRQTQFLEAFEILIIDNNSTDESFKISELYATLYANINTFQQPIKGAGNARNMGIKNAKGKYIFFLDADDVLDDRALQNLTDLAYNDISDLIVSPLIIFNENRFNAPSPEYFPNSNFNIDMKTLKTQSTIKDTKTAKYLNEIFSDFGPCAKLYKRQFLTDHNILFPENLNYEDNYFIYQAYLTASNISVCGEPTYLYRKLSTEAGKTQSTSYSESDLLDQCKILTMLIQLLSKKENKAFKIIGYHRMIIKLVWLFIGVKKLPNKTSDFYPKLSQVLSNFSVTDFEEASKKYLPTKEYINFFIAIKNNNFNLAISTFNSI